MCWPAREKTLRQRGGLVSGGEVLLVVSLLMLLSLSGWSLLSDV